MDKLFDCLVCKQKHEILKDRLPNNTIVSKILSIKPTKISRGKAFDKFQDSLKHIRMNINLIKHGINNRDDYVKEHCADLRNDVQLAAQEAIQLVNDFVFVTIKEIDDYMKKNSYI